MSHLKSKDMTMEAPLFGFNEDRDYLVDEVTRRAYSRFLGQSRQEDQTVGYILNDAAYREVERLENDQTPEEEIWPRQKWLETAKKLARLSESEKCTLLKELIETYVEDIAGSFHPWTYRLATRAVPIGLGMLFKAQDLGTLPGNIVDAMSGLKNLRDLSERVVLEGEIDKLQHLAERGTLIFVPTHSSNLDSILMGWALYDAGLPPVTYGAGKNLYTNPVMAFFMNRLGAYKVDRRLKHDLYKQTLKTYSEVIVERGYHSLFFPGGGRSRSNKVESDLKLGLLGTGIRAYINNLLNEGREQPVYVCPVTINYNLVLEGESMIKAHLRREGGRRYFLEDDEFFDYSTVVRFAMNTMQMASTTVIRFGDPFDIFGNAVDASGTSYDREGRPVDRTTYVQSTEAGEICHDELRDREYTRYTGKKIAKSYKENTVLMPTGIVAYLLFELLREKFPEWDVYKVFRLANDNMVRWYKIKAFLTVLLDHLKDLEDRGILRLSSFVRHRPPDDVLEQGLDYLQVYHVPQMVETLMNGVVLHKLDLLYYYGNRLRTYDIDADALMTRADY